MTEIRKIGERLRQAVEKRKITTELDSVPITISAGCATSDLPGTSSSEKLIKAADAVLLKAKERGRNCVVVAGEDPKPARERKNA